MKPEYLNDIANWRVEAKFEDVPKYFFRSTEYENIVKGKYALIIGRKGTGKTAIAEFITRNEDKTYYAEKLSFKNFPFNELYKLEDQRFTHPNQYITIWKYVIYSFICRMMATNKNIDPLILKQLQKAFGNNADQNLASLIERWTLSKLRMGSSGTGIDLEKYASGEKVDWTKNVEKLESIIKKYGSSAHYIVVFDELDEDFKDVVSRYDNDQYRQLITSLIKATSEVTAFSVGNGLRLSPMIFLRDDIFDLIRDNDKNKLVDVKLDLVWDKEKIKRMLAYRLSRSLNLPSDGTNFDLVWKKIFAHSRTRYGHKQKQWMSTFDFIARSTHMRPRDFIRYIQVAAGHEIENGNDQIQGETLRRVDSSFSRYLRNELVDEIESTIPEISEVFDVISHINKQRIHLDEFRKVFDELQPTKSSKLDADTCLKILFHFSVIGNSGRGKSELQYFKFEYPQRKLNFGLPIIVHRGLFKAFEII